MKLARRPAAPMTMNMTPMIDVTFLLLIFFMTVNQVSVSNKEIVELPKQPGSQDQSEATITINIDAEGELFVSGERRTEAEVVGLLQADLESQDQDPTRVNVIVRPDRRGTCRMMNRLVANMHAVGIHKVKISVEARP